MYVLHLIHTAAAAAQQAVVLAAPTPTGGPVAPKSFNTDGVQTVIIWIAATLISATGVAIIFKYSRRGAVGEATNSAGVAGLGAALVVGGASMLAFSSAIVGFLIH